MEAGKRSLIKQGTAGTLSGGGGGVWEVAGSGEALGGIHGEYDK